MKYVPMLFNRYMIQALNENRKFQTCRRIKSRFDKNNLKPSDAPIQPGDIIWIRESIWINQEDQSFCYTANHSKYELEQLSEKHNIKKIRNIHLPKEYARIFLKVTNVKIIRIQDISEQEAINEGLLKKEGKYLDYFLSMEGFEDSFYRHSSAKISFFSLWSSLMGVDSWSKNDYVWVYKYKKIEKPENFDINE